MRGWINQKYIHSKNSECMIWHSWSHLGPTSESQHIVCTTCKNMSPSNHCIQTSRWWKTIGQSFIVIHPRTRRVKVVIKLTPTSSHFTLPMNIVKLEASSDQGLDFVVIVVFLAIDIILCLYQNTNMNFPLLLHKLGRASACPERYSQSFFSSGQFLRRVCIRVYVCTVHTKLANPATQYSIV